MGHTEKLQILDGKAGLTMGAMWEICDSLGFQPNTINIPEESVFKVSGIEIPEKGVNIFFTGLVGDNYDIGGFLSRLAMDLSKSSRPVILLNDYTFLDDFGVVDTKLILTLPNIIKNIAIIGDNAKLVQKANQLSALPGLSKKLVIVKSPEDAFMRAQEILLNIVEK